MLGTQGGGSRFIRYQAIADLEWEVDANVTVKAGYVHARPGETRCKVGGRPMDFGYASGAYQF